MKIIVSLTLQTCHSLFGSFYSVIVLSIIVAGRPYIPETEMKPINKTFITLFITDPIKLKTPKKYFVTFCSGFIFSIESKSQSARSSFIIGDSGMV